ncbi:MAG: hypothetical protein HQK53_14045 [Oligoflexia bacterium]|nr:hypothetical protein [Oligoflexia bacterium]
MQKYTRLANFLTPLTKFFVTETGNKICYDALQIHGGVGYTTDFAIERLCRDIRITNIYEGTTQMQIVAAISGVISGTFCERLREYETIHRLHEYAPIIPLFEKARSFHSYIESAINHLKQKGDSVYQDYHARRLTEMSAYTLISYLLCIDALRAKEEQRTLLAEFFINIAEPKIICGTKAILSNYRGVVDNYTKIIS